MSASATGIEAGRAFLRLLLDSTEAEVAMGKFERRAVAMGSVLTSLGTRLGALSGAMAAPFLASIRIASSAQQTLQKFKQTFKDQTKAAQDFATGYSGALITAQRVTQNTLADFYNQFLGLGAGRDVALQYAEALTQAAADFESFQNLPSGDSIRRFSSALAGEIEPLRRFGIDVSDQALDRNFKSQGIVGGTRSVDLLTKGLERANIILETLGKQNVLGDVGRTFDQAENQLRGLRRAIDETAAAVGKSFLPIIQAVTPTLIAVVEAAGDFAAANPTLVTAVGASAIAVAGLSGATILLGLTLTNAGVIAGIVTGGLQALNVASAESAVGAQAAAAGANSAAAANTRWGTSATIIIGTLYEAVAANYAQATSWYAVAAATDVATAAQARYLALSFAGSGAGLLGGPGQRALPGPGIDPGTITSIRTVSVTTNAASKAGWTLVGAIKAIGSAVASQFPTVILLATQVRTVFMSLVGVVVSIARGAVAALVASMTPLAGVLSIVAIAVGYLAYEMWQTKKAQDAEAESAERATAALSRLRDAIQKSLSGPDTEDIAARLDAARDAAERYASALDSLVEAKRQLRALNESGRGDSDEANNLRSRINAEGRDLPPIRAEAEAKTEAADLASLSRAANAKLNQAVTEYAAAVQQLNEAGGLQDAAVGPDQQFAAASAVSVARANLRGARGAIDLRFKQGDPAIQGLTDALTNEVIGGTAADPQKRLQEIKAQIEQFRRFYDVQAETLESTGGDKTLIDYAREQEQRFRDLLEEAARATPSAVGGRDKPLIPGDAKDDKVLERERQQRADDEAEALSRARSSRNELIQNELDRQLADIQQRREEEIARATGAGATPIAINAINEQFNNETELARREAAKKAEDQTAKLKLEADIAAVKADGKISDAEKRIREINLRTDAELKGEGLTDADREQINRRRGAELESVLGGESERLLNEERRRRDQRRRLDISDVFTGSIATALAIGPPIGVEQQQLNLTKEMATEIKRLRELAEHGGGGIPGI